MQDSEVGQALFSLFGIAILGLVVLAVQGTRSLTWVAVMFGIPATVLLLIQAVTGDDDLLPYSSAFEAVLYFYAAAALIRQLVDDHDVTRDELFGVGATFTLVAWAFAYTYTVCQAIEPGSFAINADAAGDRTWMELLFLSFTILSSTGLSDVIPAEPFARSLVMLEQLAGLAFIAMVVSYLVALTVLGRRSAGLRSQPCRSHQPASGSVCSTTSTHIPAGSTTPKRSWPHGSSVSPRSGSRPAAVTRSCSARASATWRVRNVPSPVNAPGSGGVVGWEGSMNATTGVSPVPRTAIQPASKTTSSSNHLT